MVRTAARLAWMLALALAPVAWILGVVDEAHAVDSRPCVSGAEFMRFDFDWPKSRIHRFFDTAGVRDGLNTSETRYSRRYALCADPEGFVVVAYSRATQRPTMAISFDPTDERKAARRG